MLAYVNLRERPDLQKKTAQWFHRKWGVPTEAYFDCIQEYLDGENDYGWYICLDGDKIVAGLGVIENDFHNREDLAPNICAVYTEVKYRCKGIAGKLLNMAVEDLKKHGVSPVYLLTDHDSFYERYDWQYLCEVYGDGEENPSRMYIHY